MEIVLLSLYGLFLTFILLYSLVQLNLVISYRKAEKKEEEHGPEVAPEIAWEDLPMVTVQLPVFNELYVVERLIDTVAAFNYPKDKLEIQVLDDSTDESFEVAAKRIAELQAEGLDIQHIKRPERVGYKAGALAYGLEIAKGEFVAIFDADFVPVKDFLLKTVPHFYSDERIGVVQTRWEHLNRDYSLLTKLQAVGLDAHFTVEQQGRNAAGHFINFNGTAGIWRRTTIDDAGGWQSDTITEDLDLSYRAQLRNWRFKYLENVGSPAELPAAMEALKSQQFRWTKGAAECTIKNLPRVMRASHVPFRTKVHAIFHLMNSFVFVSILFAAVLSIPMMFIKNQHPEYNLLFQLASIYVVSFIILSMFYYTALKGGGQKATWWEFVRYFPLFLSVSMGLSLHNTIAVLEGYIGRKTEFVRTPKFNINKDDDEWKGNKYLNYNISLLTVLEVGMIVYFVWGIVQAFLLNDFGMLPFHVMLIFGFSYIVYYTFKHSRA